MKKILSIISLIFVAGCANDSKKTVQPEINQSCQQISAVKVAQPLSDGALANICINGDTTKCSGPVLAIPNIDNKSFKKDQIVKAPSGKCFVFTQMFEYTSKTAGKQTVPVAMFQYIRKSDADKNSFQQAWQMKEEQYNTCIKNMGKEANKQNVQNKCRCLSDVMFENYTVVFLSDEYTKYSIEDKTKKYNTLMKNMVAERCGTVEK